MYPKNKLKHKATGPAIWKGRVRG